MSLLDRVRAWLNPPSQPEHLRRGRLGENAARLHLERAGLKFLTSNFRSRRGEIDLVFRDVDCLVFVEVKTRSQGARTRPAAAVNARKKRRLTRAAFDYLRRLDEPRVKIRFDVVEVLVDADEIRDIRHLRCSFSMSAPYQHG